VSLFVGAIIGFAATQLKDWFDARRTKKSFVAAVGRELSTIEAQLQRAHDELTGARQRFEERGTPPQFVAQFSTTIFNSQLPRLRSLSDDLLLEVVNFYSTLPILTDCGGRINALSFKCLRAVEPAQRDQAGSRPEIGAHGHRRGD